MYSISRNETLSISLPIKSDELVNEVSVTSFNLKLNALQEIYRSSDVVQVVAGVTKELSINWIKRPEILAAKFVSISIFESDGSTPATGVTVSQSIYAWGADLALDSATLKEIIIVAKGWTISDNGKKTIVKSDADSITEYGRRAYELKENELLQSDVVAETIALGLLDTYKNARKDLSILYRGNPAVEIGDVIQATVFKQGNTIVNSTFCVNRQNWTMGDGLKCEVHARAFAQDGLITDAQVTDGADTQWQITDGATQEYQMG